ncbi:MAG TPA: NAD(P)/FAD-dependent oxidoreductase [Ohtaekwangia sp.]|nr:NAD(P)/FAD-dependent oxidoreductase [Ohtaekwangia sp.]
MPSFDIIIIGGSYAGLSAAMSLGRALRNVLVIDSGTPCNTQTPHSHNFITHDGEVPGVIARKAREQVMRYDTVTFLDDLVTSAQKLDSQFEIATSAGKSFTARKLLFTTGMKDIMPPIPGFAACWGISVLHCPYCHGYEVRSQPTGIIAQGDMAFEISRLIRHWTKDLTLFTNGPSGLSAEQSKRIKAHNIRIVETEIDRVEHENGYIKELRLAGGATVALKAVYARPALVQHCAIPEALGCEVNEQNLLKIDMFQKTTVPGIFAAGDNTTMMRAVSLAVSSGGFAGAAINKELIEEWF